MNMTLEEWRVAQKLSYQQLADRLGVSTATQARRYALGLVEASPEVKEAARAASEGSVTPEGFHRARLSFERQIDFPDHAATAEPERLAS